MRRALISVSDKSGIEEFARALAERGVELLSTGGTAERLRGAGVPVTEVSDYIGFPEIMDGRVKTLHPRIHGALLGRSGVDDQAMRTHGIQPIDLLVVNLYPFAETIARPGCSPEEAIEQVDIGGPAMLRAAAKNHARVTVIVDPGEYSSVLAELEANDGKVSRATRLRLAARAFQHTASYDHAIARWLATRSSPGDLFPKVLGLELELAAELRYGENPHQRAAFYRDPHEAETSLAGADLLQGKALSYNNLADADAALECVRQFYEPACAIVKHANPCGVAVADGPFEAYTRAHATDPQSAFGGIIAFNRLLDAQTTEEILRRQFAEVIIAPEVAADACELLAKKPNLRVLSTGWWDMERRAGLDFKRVSGGMLVQERDLALVERSDLRVVTERAPGEHEMRDLLFAWKVVKYVKSNAIVYAKDQMTIGVGAGQMSRVYSARIAAIKAIDAGLAVKGSVMASDAFFPFRDALDNAAEHGVIAVIQPGGSKRDSEVIAAAEEHNIAMVFTGMRHFRH